MHATQSKKTVLKTYSRFVPFIVLGKLNMHIAKVWLTLAGEFLFNFEHIFWSLSFNNLDIEQELKILQRDGCK